MGWVRIIADERSRCAATARPAWTTRRSTRASAWRWPRRCRPPRCSPPAARVRSTHPAASRRSCSSWTGDSFAFVVEGLGTKSVIARQVLERHGINRFADVAYDTVAAIVNDLCCVGALPLVVNAYFATGASEWYAEAERAAALLEGWRTGVRGRGLHVGRRRVAVAARPARRARHRAGGRRGRRACPRAPRRSSASSSRPGDEIVLVASSGLHANGASLARLIAERLPDGYATALPDGDELRRGAAGAVADVRAAHRRRSWRHSCRSATSATSPATGCSS